MADRRLRRPYKRAKAEALGRSERIEGGLRKRLQFCGAIGKSTGKLLAVALWRSKERNPTCRKNRTKQRRKGSNAFGGSRRITIVVCGLHSRSRPFGVGHGKRSAASVAGIAQTELVVSWAATIDRAEWCYDFLPHTKTDTARRVTEVISRCGVYLVSKTNRSHSQTGRTT